MNQVVSAPTSLPICQPFYVAGGLALNDEHTSITQDLLTTLKDPLIHKATLLNSPPSRATERG